MSDGVWASNEIAGERFDGGRRMAPGFTVVHFNEVAEIFFAHRFALRAAAASARISCTTALCQAVVKVSRTSVRLGRGFLNPKQGHASATRTRSTK